MARRQFIALLSLCISQVWAEQVILQNTETFGVLRRFEGEDVESILATAREYELDIWQITPSSVDIYIPPHQSAPESLLALKHEANIIPNHKAPTSYEYNAWNLSSLENSTFHHSYHPLNEVDRFIHDLASMHPETASVVHLGHTGEGREMLGIKLSRPRPIVSRRKPGQTGPVEKPGFVIAGAQHAREWIATSTVLYLAHALLTNTSEQHSLSDLLDTFDFYVIPAPNPDGYQYTWETDRFWYKNRQIMGPYAKCIGLDMNRNWGYKWKPHAIDVGRFTQQSAGKKKKKQPKPRLPEDPCSHWYPGHRPFEAPEVNNIANFLTTLPNLVAFVDLRSYGQMLASPYSFSCKRWAKDAEDQAEAAMGAAQAVRTAHGTLFSTGSLCHLLYRAPGNMIDWVYARAGVKYAYAAFLRDTGTYGFALPPEWIRPVGEESGNMISYLASFIAKRMKS